MMIPAIPIAKPLFLAGIIIVKTLVTSGMLIPTTIACTNRPINKNKKLGAKVATNDPNKKILIVAVNKWRKGKHYGLDPAYLWWIGRFLFFFFYFFFLPFLLPFKFWMILINITHLSFNTEDFFTFPY